MFLPDSLDLLSLRNRADTNIKTQPADRMGRDAHKNMYRCGSTKVKRKGQMQIPAEARKALGFEADTRLMVFAEKSSRRLVVTIKPLDEDLLDLATVRKARKR